MRIFCWILLTLCVCPVHADDAKDAESRFLEHVNAAPWPASLKEKHQARVERSPDGDIVILRLDGMKLLGEDIDVLVGLSHLEHLRLDYTNVTDDQLKRLAELKNLKSLTLNHTDIDDDGLKAVAKFPKLEVLCLGGVKATTAGVHDLKNARPKLSLGYFKSEDSSPDARR